MGTNPRHNGRNLTRLTISSGKRVEPRLLMAHPIGETKPRRPWLAIAFVIAVVVIIALAGRAGLR
jgi:hypothetical protein